jgi:hypothetical protein
MSRSRPSADRRRGLSLIEVMVSQSIAIVVISAMMAIVVAMVNKLQSEVAVSDAQVNLRQVSHLLIRDTQGLGSSAGATAGDFILIRDGGTNGSDTFTVFRRDESICGGSLPVSPPTQSNGQGGGGGGGGGGSNQGNNLVIERAGPPTAQEPAGTCPFDNLNRAFCNADEITDRDLMVLGADGQAVMMKGHTTKSSNGLCAIGYPTGQQGSDIVGNFNQATGRNVSNINQLFGPVPDGLGPIQVLSGNGFTYRLDTARNVLQRSTDFGGTFRDILEGVFDLQVERVYQRGTDTFFLDEGQAFPAGVTRDDFIGLRIGLVTFGRAVDGLNVPPPAEFANRDRTGAPKNRRYRASFILTAARNRSGA